VAGGSQARIIIWGNNHGWKTGFIQNDGGRGWNMLGPIPFWNWTFGLVEGQAFCQCLGFAFKLWAEVWRNGHNPGADLNIDRSHQANATQVWHTQDGRHAPDHLLANDQGRAFSPDEHGDMIVQPTANLAAGIFGRDLDLKGALQIELNLARFRDDKWVKDNGHCLPLLQDDTFITQRRYYSRSWG
jgi:hypothetical protein